MSQKKVPYGYVWFNGIVLSDRQIDQYNMLSERVAAAENTLPAGHPSIEQLKDERHSSLNISFDVQRGINHYSR